MPPYPYILTSPSSRGIGLALTRHLLRTTSPALPLIATARKDVEGTKEMILSGLDGEEREKNAARLDVRRVDFDDESTISEAASYIADRHPDTYLRLALLTPGMLVPERSPSQISLASATATLHLNLLAPLLLMKHFSPLLPKKATDLNASLSATDLTGLNPNTAIMAFMSARVGSISDNKAGGWFSYRASKAGVNSMVKSLDVYLKGRVGSNAMAVGLHPGTVKTELSREFWGSTPKEKLFEADYSAERLCGVLEGLEREKGGRCWDWKGSEVLP